jgi:hypothetical protein
METNMKRRDFLASSLAASAAGGTPLAAERAREGLSAAGTTLRPGDQGGREYYELRRYHLRRGPQTKLLDDYFREAFLPAMKRLGMGPVGVFNTSIGPGSPLVYVLIASPSIELLVTANDHLASDSEYQKAGAPVINATPTQPAYLRVESSLMAAFAGLPKLEVPPSAAERRSRIFELRIYESHSKKANRKKIEMFNNGEIAIFRRTGLRPVFFGETLIGSSFPNLTYMLVFDDLAARDRNWATFVNDPEWKKLSTTPGYTDVETVSNISNVILSPAAYSEI